MPINYRSEIDGLRAIAVVPVILFHAGITGFSGGYVGVDVFFVISGYLITSILMKDLEAGSFSFTRFYERRARRILPALSFVMLCSIPFAWLWMLPGELAAFGKSLVATSLFASNILFWRESGYFDAATELKPLLHTWSLAVEEQYYFLFPIMLAILWRLRKSAILPALFLVIIVSLAVAEWGSLNAVSANFYLLPSRIWELLIGAVVAICFGRTELRSQVLSIIGLGMVIFSGVLFDAKTPMPSVWTLLPVTGAALVLGFGRSGTVVAWLLSLRPVAGIGLISYSAYLWHQPLLAFARIRNVAYPTGTLLIALLVGTFVLAWLTWRFVERPFRASGALLTASQQVAASSFCSMICIAAVGAALFYADGVGSRRAPVGIPFNDIANIDERLAPNYGLSSSCDVGHFTLSKDCRTSENPIAVLWGDSYAMHLAPALQRSTTDLSFVQLTLSQCGPIPGVALNGSVTSWKTCIQFNDEALSWILSQVSIGMVVVSSPFAQGRGDLYRRDGSVIKDPIERKNAIFEGLKSLAAQLQEYGKRLLIVSPPATSGLDLGICPLRAEAMSRPPDLCGFSLDTHLTYNSDIFALVKSFEIFAPVVWLADYTCVSALCQTSIDGEGLYRDTGHLSIRGSARFGEIHDFAGIVRSAAER